MLLFIIIYYFLCKRVIVLKDNCNHNNSTENIVKIINLLKKTYPDATCSLDFENPFELRNSCYVICSMYR